MLIQLSAWLPANLPRTAASVDSQSAWVNLENLSYFRPPPRNLPERNNEAKKKERISHGECLLSVSVIPLCRLSSIAIINTISSSFPRLRNVLKRTLACDFEKVSPRPLQRPHGRASLDARLSIKTRNETCLVPFRRIYGSRISRRPVCAIVPSPAWSTWSAWTPADGTTESESSLDYCPGCWWLLRYSRSRSSTRMRT